MLKILKNCGFASFVEVLVTAVIFVVASLGIFASISMLRPHGADSSKKLEAAYIGKQLLDQLRGSVDAISWDNSSGDLAPGPHTKTINGYTVNWILENIADLGIRQVYLNVYYNN